MYWARGKRALWGVPRASQVSSVPAFRPLRSRRCEGNGEETAAGSLRGEAKLVPPPPPDKGKPDRPEGHPTFPEASAFARASPFALRARGDATGDKSGDEMGDRTERGTADR